LNSPMVAHLLDEIGDFPLKLQAKLLRVLQQKTFERVGSSDTVTVDVRIVAATNRNIDVQVKRGEFRSDLYYRLNVLPIYVPPLRQRKSDIPALAEFFLKKFSRETKKQFSGFTDQAIEQMLSYAWPGNVRELENAVERAVILSESPEISAELLGIDIELSDLEDDDFIGLAPQQAPPAIPAMNRRKICHWKTTSSISSSSTRTT